MRDIILEPAGSPEANAAAFQSALDEAHMVFRDHPDETVRVELTGYCAYQLPDAGFTAQGGGGEETRGHLVIDSNYNYLHLHRNMTIPGVTGRFLNARKLKSVEIRGLDLYYYVGQSPIIEGTVVEIEEDYAGTFIKFVPWHTPARHLAGASPTSVTHLDALTSEPQPGGYETYFKNGQDGGFRFVPSAEDDDTEAPPTMSILVSREIGSHFKPGDGISFRTDHPGPFWFQLCEEVKLSNINLYDPPGTLAYNECGGKVHVEDLWVNTQKDKAFYGSVRDGIHFGQPAFSVDIEVVRSGFANCWGGDDFVALYSDTMRRGENGNLEVLTSGGRSRPLTWKHQARSNVVGVHEWGENLANYIFDTPAKVRIEDCNVRTRARLFAQAGYMELDVVIDDCFVTTTGAAVWLGGNLKYFPTGSPTPGGKVVVQNSDFIECNLSLSKRPAVIYRETFDTDGKILPSGIRKEVLIVKECVFRDCGGTSVYSPFDSQTSLLDNVEEHSEDSIPLYGTLSQVQQEAQSVLGKTLKPSELRLFKDLRGDYDKFLLNEHTMEPWLEMLVRLERRFGVSLNEVARVALKVAIAERRVPTYSRLEVELGG